MRDLGLLCRNKILRPAGIVVVNGTRTVFFMSIVLVTSGPVLPWFRKARQQFFHGPFFYDTYFRVSFPMNLAQPVRWYSWLIKSHQSWKAGFDSQSGHAKETTSDLRLMVRCKGKAHTRCCLWHAINTVTLCASNRDLPQATCGNQQGVPSGRKETDLMTWSRHPLPKIA